MAEVDDNVDHDDDDDADDDDDKRENDDLESEHQFRQKHCVFICKMHLRCTASRRERRKYIKLQESVVFSYVKCIWHAPRSNESVVGRPKCCK